jgi:hypothetical protein|nr:hypothetical protein [Neorhizobium tomejilense]
MPYFHATWRRHLPSIRLHGLGGAAPDRQNFPVESGVYLATDPSVALSILIEGYIDHMGNSELAPPDAVEEMCVLVIDDTRIDARLVDIDPNIERRDLTALYRGTIDVACLPVLAVADVIQGHYSPLTGTRPSPTLR